VPGLPEGRGAGVVMGLEQRVRAMRRSARNSFYRYQAEFGNPPGVSNWRMLIARRFRISIAEVRRILGEDPNHGHSRTG